MRWTAHSSLGAATIAFYCPALIVSLALLCLRGLPRIAWFFLTLMSAGEFLLPLELGTATGDLEPGLSPS